MTKTRDLADLGGGFIQAGTGATQRTVEDKLKDVVSVKDFGAVGDGTTDDTAAIQAAIDYAASLVAAGTFYNEKPSVYFPSGKYEVTSGLEIDSKNFIHLRGEGAFLQITGTGAATILRINSAFDVTISGLAFGANPTGGAVNSVNSVGIDAEYPSRLDIIDCDFFNLNKSIIIAGSYQTQISECRFNQNTRTTAAADCSIEIKGVSGASNPGGGIHIDSCEFTGSDTVKTSQHLNVIAVDGLYISNTHFVKYSVGMRIGPTTAVENKKTYQVLLSNVYFDEGTSYCVNLTGNLADDGFISGLQFSNCYFRTCTDSVRVAVARSPLNTATIQGMQFTGCRFQSSTKRAFFVDTTSARIQDLTFTGCTFRGTNMEGVNSNAPIVVDNTQNVISLCGNLFATEANPVTYAWNIDEDTNSLLVSGNSTFLSTGEVPPQSAQLTVTNASISTLSSFYSYDGNQVSLRLPGINTTVTANGTINMATLPEHLRPSADIYVPVLLNLNGGAQLGVGSMALTAAGQLRLHNLVSGGLYAGFTAGTSVVTQPVCFTYNVI